MKASILFVMASASKMCSQVSHSKCLWTGISSHGNTQLRNFTTPDFASCCSACEAEAKCKSWCYRHFVQNELRLQQCILKTSMDTSNDTYHTADCEAGFRYAPKEPTPAPPTPAPLPTPPPAPCMTYKSSLNNSQCNGMKRNQSAEVSMQVCRNACCNAGDECNAWLWHTGGGGQCYMSQSVVDPSSCELKNGPPQWFGETRHDPPPTPAPMPPASRKKGFSGFLGNEFTCGDMKALNLSNSWWYNWITNPSQYNKCAAPYSQMGAEYVPMIHGLKALPPAGNYLKEWKAANAHYLLGYNEPDYGNGHNHPNMCAAADAAKVWTQVQEIAAQFDPPLQLVSPSISSDGWDANGRSKWLDDFWGNCTDVVQGCNVSLIKYIGFHDYEGNVTKIMSRIKGAYARYGKQIWITEFAVLGCPWCTPPTIATREIQDAYMRAVLPELDASDAVFRYAWFTSRNVPNDMNGGSSLLPFNSSDTTPTSTGMIYASRS